MTTATTARADRLREDIANADALMAMAYGTPLYHTYVARRTEAEDELRQMEAK